MHHSYQILLAAIFAIFFSSGISTAQDLLKWSPVDGTAIRQGNNIVFQACGAIQSSGDQSGEIALLWSDTRIGYCQITFQKIDNQGNPVFPENGQSLYGTPVYSNNPVMIASSDDSWIIAWEDYRQGPESDIYYEKVNSRGEPIWGDETCGVLVAGVDGTENSPILIEEGDDGCFIIWHDQSLPDGKLIRAQHIMSDGSRDENWPESGISSLLVDHSQVRANAIPDGSGGLFVAWVTVVEPGVSHIWGQHISNEGELLWGEGGLYMAVSRANQDYPQLCPDGENGVYIVWLDDRRQGFRFYDLYGQHVTSAGDILWTDNGAAIIRSDYSAWGHRLVASSQGSVIMTWEKKIDMEDNDIYAMKFSGQEQPVLEWQPRDGIPIASTESYQGRIEVVEDGSGGAYIAWGDDWADGHLRVDQYLQHITEEGEPTFQDNGIRISLSGYTDDALILCDPDNMIQLVWHDESTRNIIMQSISPDGDEFRYQDEGLTLASGINFSGREAQLIPMRDGEFAITWCDYRKTNQGSPAPYIQICRDEGDHADTLFPANGLPLQDRSLSQSSEIRGFWDGDDGVITIWRSSYGIGQTSIMAQKVSVEGERLWGEDGMYVADNREEWQLNGLTCSDGDGGAFVFWYAVGSNPHYDVFMQHISAAGERWLGEYGIQLTNDREREAFIDAVISDGEGGTIIIWEYYLDPNLEFRASRVDAEGRLLWGDGDGVVIGPRGVERIDPFVVKHPEGFVVAWEYHRSLEDPALTDIMGQFIENDGTLRWGANAKNICNQNGYQYVPKLTVTPAGVIWVLWQDARQGLDASNHRLFVQRVHPSLDDRGRLVCDFVANGQRVSDWELYMQDPNIASDGHGGLWIVWRDWRSEWSDIYGLHLRPNGEPYDPWEQGGAPICNVNQIQRCPQVISLNRDGTTGIVALWEDSRGAVFQQLENLYVQRVDDEVEFDSEAVAEGFNGATPTQISISPVFPNPFNSFTHLSYSLDREAHVVLNIYDLTGREVAGLVDASMKQGQHSAVWDASSLPSGVYMCRLSAGNSKATKKLVLIR